MLNDVKDWAIEKGDQSKEFAQGVANEVQKASVMEFSGTVWLTLSGVALIVIIGFLSKKNIDRILTYILMIVLSVFALNFFLNFINYNKYTETDTYETISEDKLYSDEAIEEMISSEWDGESIPLVFNYSNNQTDLYKWSNDISDNVHNLINKNIIINNYLSNRSQTIIIHVYIDNNGKIHLRNTYSIGINYDLYKVIGEVFGSFPYFSPPPAKVDGNLHLKITLPAKRSMDSSFQTSAPKPRPVEEVEKPAPVPTSRPRTVRTIPWGADGRPKETRNPSETGERGPRGVNPTSSVANHPAPVPTSRPEIVEPSPDEPLYVTVRQDLSVFIGNDPVAHIDMRGALDRATRGNKEVRIFLRADKSIVYGDLMNVMNLLRMAGYLKIALVGLEAVP